MRLRRWVKLATALIALPVVLMSLGCEPQGKETRYVGRGMVVGWSPDGSSLLYVDYSTFDPPESSPSLDMVNFRKGTRRRLINGAGKHQDSEEFDIVGLCQWLSPDRLAYARAAHWRCWLVEIDLDMQQMGVLAEFPGDAFPQSVLVGPKSKVVFMRDPRGEPFDPNLWMLDFETKEMKKLTSYTLDEGSGIRFYPFRHYRWSNDGDRVLFELHRLGETENDLDFLRDSLGLRVVDINTGEIAQFSSLPEKGWFLDWGGSNDELLAYTRQLPNGNWRLKVWNHATQQEIELGDTEYDCDAAAFNPDGSKIAFTLNLGSKRKWWQALSATRKTYVATLKWENDVHAP